MHMTFRKVGGCVRDQLLGVPTKDIDFSVEIPSLVGVNAATGFNAMREELEARGFHIFVETPEHGTIRAQFPRGHELRGVTTADFVLCRKEGPYSDGRRPDFCDVGTLTDDLNRRDFTVNAMAEGTDGSIIDLHGGQDDLRAMILRCVGNPLDRMREDALRAMRAIRFAVTKGFQLDPVLSGVLGRGDVAKALAAISTDRREKELRLMFQHDTLFAMDVLNHEVTPEFRDAAFAGIKLNPTTKRRLPAGG